jgi:hypothetical protein
VIGIGQRLAQPLYIILQRHPCRGRRRGPPHCLSEIVHWYDLARIQEQRGENNPLLGSRDGYLNPAHAYDERS